MRDVIRLIVTDGCESCKIAEDIIRKAIKQSTFTHIEIEIINGVNNNYKQFINRYFIHDFPTIVFMRQNNVLTKFVGTNTVSNLVKEIKYWYS